MANINIIYPPVIDNNIGAWTLDDSNKPLYFYIDGQVSGYNPNVVEVKILQNGILIYQGNIGYAADTQVANINVTAGRKVVNLNSVTLFSGYQWAENTAYRVYVRLIDSAALPSLGDISGKNGDPASDGSDWSIGATKYCVKQASQVISGTKVNLPVMALYSGLTAAESYDENSLTGSAKDNKKATCAPVANTTDVAYQFSLGTTVSSTSNYTIRIDYTPAADDTDTIYRYDIALVDRDTNKTLEAIPNTAYIDTYYSFSRKSFIYTFKQPLIDQKNYLVNIWFLTRKGLQVQGEFTFEVRQSSSGGATSTDLTLTDFTAKEDNSTPYAQAFSVGVSNAATSKKDIRIFLQKEKQENVYETIGVFDRTIEAATPATPIVPKEGEFTVYDNSIQSGVFTKYRIEIQEKGAASPTIAALGTGVSNECTALKFFDDIYLLNGSKVLCIKNTPKLEALKRNVQDVVTPTLGGAYPFVRRNAKQKYATFTLGGMITMQDGYSGAEGSDSLSRGSNTTNNDVSKLIALNETESLINFEQYKNVPSSQLERICEQQFRERIVDFLYDDQLLLFKSQEEGNMFIRLSGVTLSSEAGLGRMIYSFSATATEVQEASADNYSLMFSDPLALEAVVQQIQTFAVISPNGTIVPTRKSAVMRNSAATQTEDYPTIGSYNLNVDTDSLTTDSYSPAVSTNVSITDVGYDSGYQTAAINTSDVDVWGVPVSSNSVTGLERVEVGDEITAGDKTIYQMINNDIPVTDFYTPQFEEGGATS